MKAYRSIEFSGMFIAPSYKFSAMKYLRGGIAMSNAIVTQNNFAMRRDKGRGKDGSFSIICSVILECDILTTKIAHI